MIFESDVKMYEKYDVIKNVHENNTKIKINISNVADGECLHSNVEDEDDEELLGFVFVDVFLLGFWWWEWWL